MIGRREYVDIPELGLIHLEAKIDTGAYGTALHCREIWEEERNGKKVLCFRLYDDQHPYMNKEEHVFEHYFQKIVKSSSGDEELRYVIRTLIQIGRKNIRTAVSLANRGKLRYPVLIGRKMLKNKFIVDVAQLHTRGRLVH